MTGVDLLGVVVLAVTFALGTWTRVNMGALALVGSFGLGILVLREDLDAVLEGFPTSFFLLIFGITYLFSVAGSNGTTGWAVRGLARGVRGRPVVIPWTLFIVGAAVVSLGGPGQAVAGIIAPLGLALAVRFRISPVLPAVMIAAGICAGAFSPISILGVVTNEQAARAGLPSMPVELYLVTVAFGVGVAGVAFVLFGGLRLVGARDRELLPAAPAAGAAGSTDDTETPAEEPTGVSSGEDPGEEPADEPAADRATRLLTLGVIAAVAVGALVLGIDIGVLSICGAVLLHLALPGPTPTSQINWDVLLLICGVLTLIGVLERAGTVARLGQAVGAIGSPVVGVLVVCAVAALVSAFASSTATLGILVPIAGSLALDGGLAPLAVVAAVAVSTTLVDASPLSSAGALIVAGAPSELQRPLFRTLLAWAMALVVAVPLAAVGLLVLPTA